MTTIQEARAALEKLYRLRELILKEQGAVILHDLLPHQLPPAGQPSKDWDGWLIQAGRGAGKTAAIAKYVTDHVEGEPCMDGPMPHRMALVAPTLGDADESAERHPVCLKSLRPEFAVSTSRKGTVGRWPNGSEIKLFGTNTKRDVDRLRAGGNNCLVASTPVQTMRGVVPICDVTPSDYVVTRNGWRRVLRSQVTGVEPVITVTAGPVVITGTPDHQVWNGTEWKPLGLVDRIAAWHPSSMRAIHSTSGETGTGSHPNSGCSTESYTNPKLAQSPQATTSTTSTTTRTTTLSRTWWPSTHRSILPSTLTTAQPTGIRLAVRRLGWAWSQLTGFASGVAARIALGLQRRSTARRRVGSTGHVRGSSGCARCVAEHGKPLSVHPQQLVVHPVDHRSPLKPAEPVYDLMVEHDHEFVAGGALVANCVVWVEELAAWPMLSEAWSNLQLGLRIGPRPHWVGSTTPKMRPEYEDIVSDPRVVVTRASLNDNPYLEQSFRDRIVRLYGGTSLGAQEIDGELVEEVEGAIWTRQVIEDNRIAREPTLTRVVVGVDPSGGRDTVGIVAAGKVVKDCVCGRTDNLPHAVVLGDFSDETGSPDRWATATVEAFDQTRADRVVGEANFGGDMVEANIRTKRRNISYKAVTASRGKAIRAEPVFALYEQERVHHLGRFPELETEQVTWDPEESNWSPNRLDALVWAITELELSGPSTGVSGRAYGR